MQSPESSVQELSSFMFSLWRMTNHASFSGECVVAQLTPAASPLGGRMLERILCRLL